MLQNSKQLQTVGEVRKALKKSGVKIYVSVAIGKKQSYVQISKKVASDLLYGMPDGADAAMLEMPADFIGLYQPGLNALYIGLITAG